MKRFFKVYFNIFILCILIFFIYSICYLVVNRNNILYPSITDISTVFSTKKESDSNNVSKVNNSIINILVVGKEHVRTDTIMVVSYNKVSKEANILSIPRDTFYERKGYNNRQQKKINAIYQVEGIVGLKVAVEKITSLKINNYVVLDYNAVIKIVDIIEGVNFDVPIDMQYNDPKDTPPLEIKFSKGPQLLNGESALKLLRFRKNNDGTGYPNGDIDRIRTQQEFIKQIIKKSLSFKIIDVVKEGYNYVETDFKLLDSLSLAQKLIGFSVSENLHTTVMDHYNKNIDGLSYVIPIKDGINKYVSKLYGIDNIKNNVTNKEEK